MARLPNDFEEHELPQKSNLSKLHIRAAELAAEGKIEDCVTKLSGKFLNSHPLQNRQELR
jgi:hypothetical protein